MPGLTALLGLALTRAGRCDQGTSLLQEATARLEPRTPAFLNVAVEMGEAFTLLDRVDDALSCARHALDSGRACGERPYEASALRLLGDIGLAADPGRVDPLAAERFRESLTIADDLGMRPLVAHCHLGLGTLYRRTGQREQAQDHLTTAMTLYREMDMRFWLEKAEAEMRELTL